MQLISVRDGTKLSVDITGDGVPFVLISGLGGTARFWEPLKKALAKTEGPPLRIVCFDQRGIGGSERGNSAVTIRSLSEDTWDIISALNLEQPILCGHSTGGAIVQEMALMHPDEIAGVVLSGAWAGPDCFMQSMFGIRLDLLTKLPERYGELGVLLGYTPRWLRDNPSVLEQTGRHRPSDIETAIIQERIQALLAHDCRDRLSAIATPALVLGSEDDMIVPVYLQEELARLLHDAPLHLFDRGGHFFPVTRPEDTAQLLMNWLVKLNTPHHNHSQTR